MQSKCLNCETNCDLFFCKNCDINVDDLKTHFCFECNVKIDNLGYCQQCENLIFSCQQCSSKSYSTYYSKINKRLCPNCKLNYSTTCHIENKPIIIKNTTIIGYTIKDGEEITNYRSKLIGNGLHKHSWINSKGKLIVKISK